MSDPVFPLALPAPSKDGYSVSKDKLASEFKTDLGGRRVRATQLASFETHSVSWRLSQAQYDDFESFCEDVLIAYSGSFVCPWDDGEGGTLAQRVVFDGLPSTEWLDGLDYRVTAKLMTAGAPLGEFGGFINVDGTSGGPGPIYGGSGGQLPPGSAAQDPLRRINLSDRIFYHDQSNILYLRYTSSGRFNIDGNSTTQTNPPNWEWMAQTNTSDPSEYIMWGTHEILEVLDVDYATPSQNYIAATQMPTVISNLRFEDSSESSPISMSDGGGYPGYAYFFHEPNNWKYVRHKQKVYIKDTVSGFVASATYIIHIGSRTP